MYPNRISLNSDRNLGFPIMTCIHFRPSRMSLNSDINLIFPSMHGIRSEMKYFDNNQNISKYAWYPVRNEIFRQQSIYFKVCMVSTFVSTRSAALKDSYVSRRKPNQRENIPTDVSLNQNIFKYAWYRDKIC